MRRAFLLLACLMTAFPAAAEDAQTPIAFARDSLTLHVAAVPADPKLKKPGRKARDLTFAATVQNPQALAVSGMFVNAEQAPGTATLTLYPAPQRAAFPLGGVIGSFDLLMVEATGDIAEIYPALDGAAEQPPVESAVPVLAMVQLPAGTCDKEGIRPGDRFRAPYFTPPRRTIEAAPR